MDAVIVFILTTGAVILAFCIGQWLGAKAIEAHGRAEVAKMMRDPDELDEKAAFFRDAAKEARERRKDA